MERALRVTDLWSWLPAFRAVAETEHLPTAAKMLHLTPSALSRTIRLLERDVGQPLFERSGRRIVLNAAGRKLLVGVRDAMRRVDDGLHDVVAGGLLGPVHISVPGPYAPIFVLPALTRLRTEHPGLEPHLHSQPSGDLGSLLLRGTLDVALTDTPRVSDELSVARLATITHGVWCGRAHPLARKRRVTIEQLAEHFFAAPTPLPDGTVPDPWPPELERRIGVSVTHMQVAVDACRVGDAVAALPDCVAERHELVRLPLEEVELEPSTYYAIHRPTLTPEGPTEAVMAALREVAQSM